MAQTTIGRRRRWRLQAMVLAVMMMAGAGRVCEAANGDQMLEFETKFGVSEVSIMEVVYALQREGIHANLEVPTTPYKRVMIDVMQISLKDALEMARHDLGFDYHKDAHGYTFFDPTDLYGDETSYLDKKLGPVSLINVPPYQALTSLGPALKIGIVSPKFSRNLDGKKVTLQGDAYSFREALDQIAAQAGFMGWIYTKSHSLMGEKEVVVVYFGIFRPALSMPKPPLMEDYEGDSRFLQPWDSPIPE